MTTPVDATPADLGDAQPPTADIGWRSWRPQRPAIATTVLISIGVVVLVARRPTALTDPGLYAEDGVIFLLESLRDGPSAVVEPYNGYIHLLPRLIAAAVEWLPLAWTPVLYSIATAVVSAWSAALVLSSRFARLVPAYPVRVALFTSLLLVPRLTEVHLALNSVLWWCAVALLLTALCDDPTTTFGRIGEVAMVAVSVMSGLAGVVLAPIAAARWARTRSRPSLVVLGTWWGCALVQLAVYLTQDRQNGSVPIGPPLIRAAIEKTVGALVLGRRSVDEHWAGGVPTLLLVGLGLLALTWAAIVVCGLGWTDWAAIAWTVTASVVAGFLALGPAAAALPDRYTVLPITALVIGLFAARPPWRALAAAQVALIIVVLALRATDFVVPARPSTDWADSVDCLDDVSRECVVELNPDGWTLTLPPGLR